MEHKKIAPTGELLIPSLPGGNNHVENEESFPSYKTADDTLILKEYGIGIDCHSRFIQVCILKKEELNENNNVARYDREFRTAWADLLCARDWISAEIGRNNFDYTLESTGPYHFPVIRAFQGRAHVVNPLLANPSRRKTDVLDARLLAHQAITGMWPESFIPEEPIYVGKILWAERRKAKTQSNRVSNRAINYLTRFGHSFGTGGGFGTTQFGNIIEDLRNGQMPGHDGVCLLPTPREIFVVLAELEREYNEKVTAFKAYEKQCVKHLEGCEFLVQHGELVSGKSLLIKLKTVPGIGTVAAITWMLEVVNPNRFPNAKAIAAYAGCDPSLKVSAGKVTQHIRRKGNNNLHLALMQSAAVVLRMNEEPLGMWGRSIWKRSAKGGWKRACGAVARRLSVALWHINRTMDDFSYDSYHFLDAPNVKIMPIEMAGFDTRTLNVLKSLAIADTTQLAKRYATDLADQPGVGETCLKKVKIWIEANSVSLRRAQSSAAQSE